MAPWVIAVGAMAYDNDPWGNTGSRAYTDVAAPGEDVLTTSTDTQAFCTGTSCAAPFVTGTVGLMLAANSGLKNYEIEQILKRTAQEWGNPHDGEIGYGMIDAYAALQRVTSPYSVYRNDADFTKIHDNVQRTFTNSPGHGLASGNYWCDVWEMEASASYNYTGAPWAFLSVSEAGFSAANPNNAQRWTDESVSSTSMYLQTFFYYIRSQVGGATINRWVPFDPTLLDPTYSLVGIANTYPSDPELEAVIDGPTYVDPYSIEMFTADVSNGTPPYSYQWKLQIGSGSWNNVGIDSQVYDRYAEPSEHYALQVVVTDSNSDVAYSPIHYVSVGSMLRAGPPTPEEFDLEPNRPNPFNPSTQIRFALPEPAHVRLTVYDVTGRQVRQLVNIDKAAGYHEATFDASGLASGVYLVRIHAVGASGQVFTNGRQMTVVK